MSTLRDSTLKAPAMPDTTLGSDPGQYRKPEIAVPDPAAEFTPPDENDESSEPEPEDSQEESEASAGESAPESVPAEEEPGAGINAGRILAFTFVGLTFAAAAAASVTGIRRRRKKSARTGAYSARRGDDEGEEL